MYIRRGRNWIRITKESCGEGLHLPDRTSITVQDGTERARCKHCSCELVRMANAKRWRFCGQMGAPVKVEESAC